MPARQGGKSHIGIRVMAAALGPGLQVGCLFWDPLIRFWKAHGRVAFPNWQSWLPQERSAGFGRSLVSFPCSLSGWSEGCQWISAFGGEGVSDILRLPFSDLAVGYDGQLGGGRSGRLSILRGRVGGMLSLALASACN